MTALPATFTPANPEQQWSLVRVAKFPGLRALAWADDYLYASRSYELMRARIGGEVFAAGLHWDLIANFRATPWRSLSSATRLSSRLLRDGFHALAVLPSAEIVGAVPGSIVSLAPNETEFRVTHRVTRGTRPLHITAVPNGTVFWGEYFDNPARDEVHIYALADQGSRWEVAYTFPRGAIRHVHNIVHDPWGNCLWVLTGDYGHECRILRASCDFSQVDVVLAGNQQARAVALVPTEGGLYFSSDTPLEQNFVYHLDRQGTLSKLVPLSSSSIYGCRVGRDIFFSTMVEPSTANPDRNVRIYGGRDGHDWRPLLAWQKDRWPFALFQYGNAFLPDGNNTTPYLATTTVAVKSEDMVLSLYSIHS
jgi:hypothetical protein